MLRTSLPRCWASNRFSAVFYSAINRIIVLSGGALLEDHVFALTVAKTQAVLRQQLDVPASRNEIVVQVSAVAALQVHHVWLDQLGVVALGSQLVYLPELDYGVLAGYRGVLQQDVADTLVLAQ